MSGGQLRVLVANERPERIALVSELVAELGHSVVAGSSDVAGIGRLTTDLQVDVALVGVGTSAEYALELIERIARQAECPVVAVLETRDATFINEAARRGVFAYVVDGSPEELQSALDITLRRFAEYHDLQGAFGRRATTERAKGILMERHGIDEQQAFEMLRDQSRRTGRKLINVARALLEAHLLLPPEPGPGGSGDGEPPVDGSTP
jgi:AmiR/NasT family two-component response regulator